jgi:hypothetical protein
MLAGGLIIVVAGLMLLRPERRDDPRVPG